MARRAVLILIAFAAPLLIGCGYKVVRYEGGLGEVHLVSIQTPHNDSFEPGIEYVVANALRREFLRRGAVRLTDDPEKADLVVGGRVRRIATSGRSFSSVVLTLEYTVTLSLDLEAIRKDGTEIGIDSHVLKESERYLASADVEAMRKNRKEALHRLSRVIAGRFHDSLYEVLVQ